VVESTALEMRRTRKGTGGSNPSLSARILRSIIGLIDFYAFDRRPALTILEANDVMAGDGGAGLLARLGFWPFPG
jgi:hypothetical protein